MDSEKENDHDDGAGDAIIIPSLSPSIIEYNQDDEQLVPGHHRHSHHHHGDKKKARERLLDGADRLTSSDESTTSHDQQQQDRDNVEMEDVELEDQPLPPSTHQQSKLTRFRQWLAPLGNTFHLGIGFLLVFFGYSPTQNLTTSIHPNTGSLSLGILYFAFAIGCLISPVLTKKIGLIKSLFLSGITYSLFIVCSIDVLWFFYLPSAFIIGIGAAVLWTAQPTYLSRAAPSEHELGKYSSIFQTIYSGGAIFGNAMSGTFTALNLSTVTMLIIFTVVTTVGSFILAFLKPIPAKSKEKAFNLKQGIAGVFLNLKHTDMLLLTPFLIQQGQSYVNYYNNYTTNYRVNSSFL
ncbi:hypothetical protein DFA_11746 [Cavenderia fasciculata]|uniref:Major facilitator superfamily (MFS) profile domain-containing protein n=1 Tax=Cavenderia fasciculata TaxID=261658 RepID=F4QE38_CACFS|nr:uncharacterized protein DFA_11746 [Cavenderia fasciculata]EGG13985.1 hypothetical protein DFA_11746 [Cavenderia fasciculata]|eukprot:XP_004350693.1 hypothetical protein DFA_11746 [Cavenderia fasciculata]